MSIESLNEYNVPSQDQEFKGSSQDHRPRLQNDVDPHMTSTVKPEYPATQRVKKAIKIEYDEERPSTIKRTIEFVPDKAPIHTEEPVAPRQVNLRTTRSIKKGQVIGAEAAASSMSREIKTRSKIPVRSKLRFVSDKDLPKFMEITNLSVSVKPTKPLSRLLQVEGKMEENGLEFSVNNEEPILGKPNDGMKKINDVENDGCSQTICGVTQRYKLKIQQRDNGNSPAGKSEANVQDHSSEARDNYEQSFSSAVANQSLISGFPPATPDNHRQISSSAVANQPFILGYPFATFDNH